MDNTQNIISFCTGYGGIELGLRRAGVDVRTVVNVEIEAFCCANLAAKIEEGRMDDAPIYTDLKTFPARIFRGKIHGIIGGYPCQPFSSAGKRKGEKDPRHLWPYIREHVRAVRPLWCFFENVRGHTSMGLWRVLSDLEEDGYRTEWGLFSAEETGAPHQRIRCFILAYRECAGSQGWIYGGQNKEREGVDGYSRCGVTGAHGRRDSEQLGDTCSDERWDLCGQQSKQGQEAQSRSCNSSESELADSEGNDEQRRDTRQGEVQSRGSGTQPEELAHTASREPRQSQARNGGQDTSGGSEEELGDTKHDGSSTTQDRRSVSSKQEEGRMQELEGGCKQSQDELGDTQHDGLHGYSFSGGSGEDCERSEEGKKASEQSEGASGQKDLRYLQATRWPARPGEEQYEWEEPRVVADRSVKRCGGRKNKDGENGEGLSEQEGEERSVLRSETEGCSGNEQTTINEIIGKLGRAVDGTRSGVDPIANRVDRLRLLGNGVVPQCAEIAWRTLWKEINK